MKNIAIFASGSGTNAQRIAEFFGPNPEINITRIYSNKPDAYILTRARNLNIPLYVFNRSDFYHSDKVINQLINDKTDLIVLAGFLWLVPDLILSAFGKRIINIHPALLPKYGGKGMFGHHVHQAVIHSGDAESGITIHYVNEKYDDGDIIFQAWCPVKKSDTPESLAAKIHDLEYIHFPVIIQKVIDTLS